MTDKKIYTASKTCRRCGATYASESHVSVARARQGATNKANTCAYHDKQREALRKD